VTRTVPVRDWGNVICAFEVAGEPVPKARPRVGRRGGRTPERTRSWEETVGWAAKQAYKGEPVSCEVAVSAVFHTRRTRPGDLDNLLKSVLDALNGIVWDDDIRVSKIIARREPTSGGPKLDICVLAL
jgi:Holliday junction resolvase RusA-like endonuclease